MNENIFSKDHRKLLNHAIQLNNNKKHQEALDIFIIFEKKYPKSSVISGLIATTYLHLQNLKKSKDYFKKTTKLNPKSEIASLGYYHCLWENHQEEKALKEIERYISSFKADHYIEALQELHDQIDEIKSKDLKNKIEEFYLMLKDKK